ncbi:MAG: B12-binding domain-containing radical SAM protein [Desulfobacteraceae bacterium]
MTRDLSRTDRPHILLVNPWIHDFAAYDVWAKPYGLLSMAAWIRAHGLSVSYIDCLDRFHPQAPITDPHARNGRGPYHKIAIAPPKGLENIERTYSRYGIDPDWFRADLRAMPQPDLVLVTSIMTYWYPGVVEAIAVVREIYPEVPVVLGGIYARLCSRHARDISGADEVVGDRGETLFERIGRHTGYPVEPSFDISDMDAWPYPAFDLQRRIGYVPLLTTRGCPFNCAYCASRYLEPRLQRHSPEYVVDEIAYWHRKHRVIDFAFYDDALMVDAENHALPIFERVIDKQMPVKFHTPNAVHIRSMTKEAARLMKRTGFHTLRLGLETTAFEERSGLDGKVTEDEFLRAVGHLKSAGFEAGQIGAYLLVGLPHQTVTAVETSIKVVKSSGITPVLAYYTPIPHTPLWLEAVAVSRYDLEADPIYTNNAIFPCQRESFSWQTLSRLKRLVKA